MAFAFLFGSQARGRAHMLSDVDIAVYFRPRQRYPLEREAEVFYPAEGEIWTDLERLLQREVEVLVLNRAPASVAFSAIGGTPLAVNDVRQYLDFSEVVSFEAMDFREMLIRDFLEIRIKPEATKKEATGSESDTSAPGTQSPVSLTRDEGPDDQGPSTAVPSERNE